MAYPSVTYSFSNSSTADASHVNQNFTDLINGFSDGTKDLNMLAGTFAKTTNQLILGTTNTVTISSTAPAASRVYTLGDAGAAASFVMTEGAQTINGVKTFGTAIALASGGTGTAAASANAAFNALSPMTTGGDLIYGGASGAGTRLANGSAGQYLASAGGTSAHVWTSFPRSEVFVDTGNGHGATATKVRRFTNARLNTGTAITYADDANTAGTFTINETGVYAIFYSDYKSTGTIFLAIVVNASSTTTSASSLTYANGRRHGTNNSAGGVVQMTSWTGILTAGDVVRAINDGSADSADAFCSFSIAKVSA